MRSCASETARVLAPRSWTGIRHATPNSTRCAARRGRRLCCRSRRRSSFAIGGGSQTPLFTIFGSVALLIIVDFPGNRPARALAYCGLGFNGAVLITLGTLVAPHPVVERRVMFVLGVAVTFAGVLSEIVAAGQRATLLMFVLPACTPVGPLPERLLGWLIALAVCVPAALFLLPAAASRRAAALRGAGVQSPGRPAGGRRVGRAMSHGR